MAEVIQGMDELQKQLRALEYSQQRKVLIDAAKAGGELIRKDAARRAPRETGALAAGIKLKVVGNESDIFEATVSVGSDDKQFYGYFQEFGTGSYFNASGAQSIGMPGLGGKPPSKQAQPFLLPAFEANQAQAAIVMREKMIEAVNKAVS